MKLAIATGDYAHTRSLAEIGSSRDGLEIDWMPGRPETIFRRALSDEAPFDVAEMSLATTWALAAKKDTRFLPLPVFPSRMYRLSAFYVQPDIEGPGQLAGGRFGVVRYGQTAAVWARAWLEQEFGVEHSKLSWWVAERQSFEPGGVELNHAGNPAALEKMLAAGQLDCLIATSVPKVFLNGKAKRLFPDWPRREKALFQRSGCLPIMHTVLVRRSLVKAHPELPGKLVACFDGARHAALEWLADTDASVLPVPLHHGWVETLALGGARDHFESGLERNRAVLDAFASHMHVQGLTSRRIAPDEVFRHGA